MCCEQHKESKDTPVFAVYLDGFEAFDRTNHNQLFAVFLDMCSVFAKLIRHNVLYVRMT